MNLHKTISIFAGMIIVVTGVYFIFLKEDKRPSPAPIAVVHQLVFDAKNASYDIEGVSVALVNGISEVAGPSGSATKTITRYFGNNATGDLTGDGVDDSIFLITQDRGGSGLFYYAVAVLTTAQGYATTNTYFIGDRIAPQSTNIMDGVAHVNYATRNPGEPMTARASLGAEARLVVTPDGKLISAR